MKGQPVGSEGGNRIVEHPTIFFKQWLAIRKQLLNKKLTDQLAAELRLAWVRSTSITSSMHRWARLRSPTCSTDAAGPGGPLRRQHLLHERHRQFSTRTPFSAGGGERPRKMYGRGSMVEANGRPNSWFRYAI